MDNVTLPVRKWLVAPAMDFVAYAQQIGSELSSTPMALMIGLAAVTQMTVMTLRDAEFRTLTETHGLNAKDVFAYACTLVFDAILLFGLITGAGLLLPWERFLPIAAIVAVVMPLMAVFITRKHYDPKTARTGLGMFHWVPPLLLACLAFYFLVIGTLQAPSGSQPYVWLVLMSVIAAATDPTTRFTGFAKNLRVGALAGAMILITWNYLNIA